MSTTNRRAVRTLQSRRPTLQVRFALSRPVIAGYPGAAAPTPPGEDPTTVENAPQA